MAGNRFCFGLVVMSAGHEQPCSQLSKRVLMSQAREVHSVLCLLESTPAALRFCPHGVMLLVRKAGDEALS